MRIASRLLGCLILFTMTSSESSAHSPVEFLEAFTVTAANEIEHDVDLRNYFEEQKRSIDLIGPQRFSQDVGCLGRRQNQSGAFLSWYRFVSPVAQPKRTVSVLDLVRGGDNMDLAIGDAQFFLTPTQPIKTGKPDPVPEGLDHYTAFQVIDGTSIDRDVQIRNLRNDESVNQESGKSETRKILKPLFVCVATEVWHHDEYFPASHRRACFVVYKIEAKPSDFKVNTIDQFGLSQLQATSSEWLTVRGTLLDSKTN